ncbi:4-hydroxy-3-methylbut-2-enyl diphosphate reductase [hydrothermal vent metagenome]|uniref:4-hydroxy-3-methylbut-2-enyl diphosphate reductase n=1 Tax=hydrothermal vent metagenome TaxID=652676 RepID=A0A3B0TWN7_9ZZZZ
MSYCPLGVIWATGLDLFRLTKHRFFMKNLPPLKIILCSPRGFCAGVDRAVQIVEKTLEKYGAPVYVRHEIVHNKYVVDSLKEKGAIFVEELEEIADTDAPVIFSAHGVAKTVPQEAQRRNMFVLDATCPLVSKVHVEASHLFDEGHHIILIGHRGHPEVIGTMGQLPQSAISLVETVSDAEIFAPKDNMKLAFVTQTTLSLDDTAQIVAVLQARFPQMKSPAKQDICYATTNRQRAVKLVAPQVDAMIVVGAPNSSNSMRLVEVAQRSGCKICVLAQRAAQIEWEVFFGVKSIGITAGASAPEILVDEIIAAFAQRFDISVSFQASATENIAFNLPRKLRT